MSQRAGRRRSMFVLPVGLVVRTVVVVLAAFALIGVIATGTIARLAGGAVVADPATVAAQRSVAERDLERGYEQATGQVRKARGLNLAISAQQADTIANKALADLFTLRHSALITISQSIGGSADAAESYAKSTEQALDAKAAQPQPSADPVLLAPRFYAIVSRFNQLATQLTDQAVADLTQAASPAPTPSARPTPTPSPTR
ncbi:MAG TPA: hypothetical protein VGT60_11975 [Candidatus Limnocylindria bacterium]|nr:hypothetical protein [Candidatus Limnocylindria bacterium]